MKWSGKLVGGALGLAFGPVGVALGVLAGHLYDEKSGGSGGRPARDARDDAAPAGDAGAGQGARRSAASGEPGARRRRGSAADRDPEVAAYQDSRPHRNPAQVAARFFRTTFEVMGHVAKADGRVSEQEIQAARAVMDEFGLDAAQVAAAIGHFSTGKQPGYDLGGAIMGLRRACAGRPDLLGTFLEIQMRAAIAGTDLRGPVRPLMLKIAAMLGVGGLEFAHVEAVLRLRHGWAGSRRSQAGGEGRETLSKLRLEQAYEVLEVAASASDEEVTRAYRRQLSRHHPDKLKANGLPESMLEHAKRRTQQVIEAWELVREKRGLQ
ncbi:MAG: co-chaperone DjlA [Steroidobacteraceae bacterium]|jgi:DnaJ like chaperone protein|nr:co-chaperone DjlA [Steroidobacteraceae bacterium]